MGMKNYKSNTLSWLFLKQLLALSFSILLEIVVFILFFYFGFYHGFILPANYSYNYIIEHKTEIANSEPFDETLLPYACKYGLYDLNDNYIAGNFNQNTMADAKVFLKDTKTAEGRYIRINREDGYCIVKYDLFAHFSSPTLHKIFPKLELIMIILFLIIFILIALKNAFHMGKKLNKELTPVFEEIELIQSREIHVEPKTSKINEINNILVALNDMQIALAQSLNKQWEIEQRRKNNISALAHDIKTPLTIIKGNSELILEEESMAEVFRYADKINHSSDKIERYISLLIDETKNDFTTSKEEKVSLAILINDIIIESEAYCNIYDVTLTVFNGVADREIIINRESVIRAVINLVRNAVEHTDNTKKINIYVKETSKLFIEIEDFGTGFTKEALKYAKDQFYTEKTERSGEHYGLGMFYANYVAEMYNGRIDFYNKLDKTGAVVIFEISVISVNV